MCEVRSPPIAHVRMTMGARIAQFLIFSKWYISDNIKKERKKNNLRPLVLPYSRLLLVQGEVYYRSCGRWTLLYKTYVIFDIHSLQRGESTCSCLLSSFLLLSTRYERYLMTIGEYFSWFFNYQVTTLLNTISFFGTNPFGSHYTFKEEEVEELQLLLKLQVSIASSPIHVKCHELPTIVLQQANCIHVHASCITWPHLFDCSINTQQNLV